jgi:hypothetical protein
MTLSTYVRVLDPTAVRPVFDYGRELLACTDDNPWKVEDGGDGKAMLNVIGQGLPSMLIVQYGHDGPLPADEDEGLPAASLSINFDTAYGYKGPQGSGCRDLHAWLVREMGKWLDARGLRWMWQNEFTGDWFTGTDGLDDLGDADRGALRDLADVG